MDRGKSNVQEERIPRPGKLKQPYPVEHCALSTCGVELGEDAYLFKDLESGKLVVFCGDCTIEIELHHRQRFLLVAL